MGLSGVELGVIQRAELLNLVLTDLYGPRQLLRRGVLPPELVLPGSPPRWRVFEIAVRVTWDEHRQIELATLRTVPAVTTPVLGTRAPPGQNPIPRGGGTQ